MKLENNIYKNIFLATTDTVPGIGCPYDDLKSLDLIFEIKKRPKHKKIVIMVASIEQAKSFEGWNDNAEKLAKEFWPGALTIILNDDVALRMPNCKQLLELMKKIGPIYMTSANISGENNLSIDEAIKTFNMIEKHYVECIGDGKPSKIIDSRDYKVIRS